MSKYAFWKAVRHHRKRESRLRYYFLGIAGTAMASLAALLKQKGHEVWGSDRELYPPMSEFLSRQKIEVQRGFSEQNLSRPFDCAVIGNALSRGNVEVEAILNHHLPFVSLPELIHREFISEKESVVITGTHGKTTCTALLSWLIENAGRQPSFLIGGIAKNFDSSIQLKEGPSFIIEGDEYDSAFFDKTPKFLHYFPRRLLINNIEFDHADIYRNLEQIKDAFRKLIRTVPGNGLIVANADDEAVREVTAENYSRLQTFGLEKPADWSANQIRWDGRFLKLAIYFRGDLQTEVAFPFPGEFQAYNILGVVALARDLGLTWPQITAGLESFQGVARRLEFWGKFQGAPVFDDFAHHPTAIKKTLSGLRSRFPQRRIIALFEPRTNTMMRNVFQEVLPEAFTDADVVLIAPPPRHKKVPGSQRLSLADLAKKLQKQGKKVLLLDAVETIPGALKSLLGEDDVCILLTNGDLGGIYPKLRKMVRRAKD